MGIVFQSDIERDNHCIENPDKWCTDNCKKFISAKCDGAKLIQQGTRDFYRYRSSYGFQKRDGKAE